MNQSDQTDGLAYIIFIVLVLFSIHFWGWVRIPKHYENYTDLIALGVMGISTAMLVRDKSLIFRNAILIYLFGLIFNILSAYLNNGQSIRDTTLSLGYFYFILLYFWLNDQKIERKYIENMIIVFAILYALFYQIQVQEFPHRVFRGTLFADRGTVRLRMQGASFNVLAYFMMLNRYLLNRKLAHLFLALLFFFTIIYEGTRTFAAGSILMSGVMFLRMVRYSPMNYFLIVFAVLLLLGIMQLEAPSRIIQGMIDTTEQQQAQGDQYIRVLQRKYFTEEYPKNWTYFVVGGGYPGGYGAYSHYMGTLVERYGFYWEDQGLLGFYLVMGLATLAGLLLWVVKSIFIKLPPDRFYLKMYFAFLLVSSNIVMDEIFSPGVIAIQAIALYLIDAARKEMKVTDNNSVIAGNN